MNGKDGNDMVSEINVYLYCYKLRCIITFLRSVVECWKSLLTVPYTVIYSLMEVKDGAQREVEAGLQLLGIMLANGLSPYTADSETEKKR